VLASSQPDRLVFSFSCCFSFLFPFQSTHALARIHTYTPASQTERERMLESMSIGATGVHHRQLETWNMTTFFVPRNVVLRTSTFSIREHLHFHVIR
jgi:hypothetical protein